MELSRLILKELGLRPVIDAHMALGEGTGAVMLAPQLDVALALYEKGSRFKNIDMEAYSRF